MPEVLNCSNCRFWKGRSDQPGSLGECRRFPPAGNSSNPPAVVHGFWCGEHQPLKEFRPRWWDDPELRAVWQDMPQIGPPAESTPSQPWPEWDGKDDLGVLSKDMHPTDRWLWGMFRQMIDFMKRG